jgi:hypothetical protein
MRRILRLVGYADGRRSSVLPIRAAPADAANQCHRCAGVLPFSFQGGK